MTRQSRNGWWEWTMRIAAMLSIPLAMGVLMLANQDEESKAVAQMMEVKTNPGMSTTVVLPDSTVVQLNSESTLRYPAFFSDDSRRVELKGEAYFYVKHDARKRFVVNTPHQSQVEVYGTSFNVEAYESDNKVSATLVEGKIGFRYKDTEGTERSVRLSPHQKVVYQLSTGMAKLYATDCLVETSWKDGKLIFDNTPLEEILRMLGKRFNVEFIVKNKKLLSYSFTGTFTNQRLERILEYFKVASHIRWRYVDSKKMEDLKQRIELY